MGGGWGGKKSEIREENSKLIRKRRDKKGRKEKNSMKNVGKGRRKENYFIRNINLCILIIPLVLKTKKLFKNIHLYYIQLLLIG